MSHPNQIKEPVLCTMYCSIHTYGSVSPGGEFLPFHDTKLKNVKLHCSLTDQARPDFLTVLSSYDVQDQYFIEVVPIHYG